MAEPATSSPRRRARLVEELAEHGLDLDGSAPWHDLAVTELDYALRPHVHERRVPSYGALVVPTTDPETWSAETQLTIDRRRTGATSRSKGCSTSRARPKRVKSRTGASGI